MWKAIAVFRSAYHRQNLLVGRCCSCQSHPLITVSEQQLRGAFVLDPVITGELRCPGDSRIPQECPPPSLRQEYSFLRALIANCRGDHQYPCSQDRKLLVSQLSKEAVNELEDQRYASRKQTHVGDDVIFATPLKAYSQQFSPSYTSSLLAVGNGFKVGGVASAVASPSPMEPIATGTGIHTSSSHTGYQPFGLQPPELLACASGLSAALQLNLQQMPMG